MSAEAPPPAKRPAGLKAPGRRAWDRAIAGLTDPERETFADVAERYARQVDVAEALRREWVRLGCPALADGANDKIRTHPLVSSMRQVDATIAVLAKALRLTPAAVTVGKPGRTGDRTPDRQPAAPKTGEPPRFKVHRGGEA